MPWHGNRILRVSDPVVDARSYAWNWFALHSGQRMQLVNFWLVAVAFLGAAFVQARTGNLRAVAVGICVAGAVSSVGFAMLDARTRRLVLLGEVALKTLEDARAAAGEDANPRLVTGSPGARASRLSSYRVVIEAMQLTVAVLFAAAAVITVAGV
jgi:hypothetical protein